MRLLYHKSDLSQISFLYLERNLTMMEPEYHGILSISGYFEFPQNNKQIQINLPEYNGTCPMQKWKR